MHVVTLFAMVMILMLLAKHIKDLLGSSKVFPFVFLTLTPLIVLHVLNIDVNLADVVKLLIQRLFSILTYDLFDSKATMSGEKLLEPSLLLPGYKFVSLINNLGVTYCFVKLFLVCLLCKLALYIFEVKVTKLPKGSLLRKYIHLRRNLEGSVYN